MTREELGAERRIENVVAPLIGLCVYVLECAKSGMRENRVDRSHDADYSQLPSVTALVAAGSIQRTEAAIRCLTLHVRICVSGEGSERDK